MTERRHNGRQMLKLHYMSWLSHAAIWVFVIAMSGFLNTGARFTYTDGRALHWMVSKGRVMNPADIAGHYGKLKTDFRHYLEGVGQ